MMWPDGEPILGLTFQQPYGSAIIDGPKRDENRSRPPPPRFQSRAFWIAIHAGATFYDGVTRETFTAPQEFDAPPMGQEFDQLDEEAAPALWPECPDFATLPRRCILGAARVVGWTECPDGWLLDRPWAFGPWVWRLDPTVIRLPQPLPLRLGALGLWRMVPEMSDRPERVSVADWTARIAEGRAALDALRAAKNDRSCWRTS